MINTSGGVWLVHGGVIQFSVVSEESDGRATLKDLREQGFCVDHHAEKFLLSPDYAPTRGATTKVVVLPSQRFRARQRITPRIRSLASNNAYSAPDLEVESLILQRFHVQDFTAMGLRYIVVMHNPVRDVDGDPRLLVVLRVKDGLRLSAYHDRPDCGWPPKGGFAFAM